VTTPRGYATTYDHDAMGRVIAETDPLAATESREYNLAGQLTRRIDRNGTDLRYAYDTAGRLKAITDPSTSPYVSYTLDELGRPTGIANVDGTLGYTYDAAGRVVQTASPQGTISYAYNDDGQRAQMTLPAIGGGSPRTVTYDYDATGFLETVTDWNSNETSYQFTDGGQVSRIDRENGVYSLYDYDGASRLKGISHYAPSDDPIAEYGYTLDANSNRTQVVITGSGVNNHTEEFAFDALDRLTNATYGPSANASFTYDQNGNRLTMTTGGDTATYNYDEADQLAEITGAQSHTYTYDDNGNRTGVDADAFTFDWANRLTSAAVGSTTTDFAYGGDDSRLSKTTSTTTSYLLDRSSGLPMVVDDGTTSAVGVGSNVIAEVDNSSGDATYPLTDALGSVRARVDDTGAVVGTADWDAFGNERSTTGVGGLFGWTGEQQDAETGLTYLRARYYAPGSGRFLSRDTVQPGGPGTQGYNRYTYAVNNPVTHTDPSGHVVALLLLGLAVAAVFLLLAWYLQSIVMGAHHYDRDPSSPDGSSGFGNGPGDGPGSGPGGGLGSSPGSSPGGSDPEIPSMDQKNPGGPPRPFPEFPDVPGSDNPNRASLEDLQRLGQRIYYALWAAGYKGVRVLLRGSRYTGFSDGGGAVRPDSDWDIGIADGELFDKAKNAGFDIKSRNNFRARTWGIEADDMEGMLGIPGLPAEWATRAYLETRQRRPIYGEVTYAIYKTFRGYWDVVGGYGNYEQLQRPGIDFAPYP
jgi:RHS repeat-associated protein